MYVVMNGLLLPPALHFNGQAYSKEWRLLRSRKSGEIDSQGTATVAGTSFFWPKPYNAQYSVSAGSGPSKSYGPGSRRVPQERLQFGGNNGGHHPPLPGIALGDGTRPFPQSQKSPNVKDISTRQRELTASCFPGAERL